MYNLLLHLNFHFCRKLESQYLEINFLKNNPKKPEIKITIIIFLFISNIWKLYIRTIIEDNNFLNQFKFLIFCLHRKHLFIFFHKNHIKKLWKMMYMYSGIIHAFFIVRRRWKADLTLTFRCIFWGNI